MKKSRFWIVVSLVLVFAAGIVGGIFGHRWFLVKKPEARRGDVVASYPSHERLIKDLGLTVDQQEKIREIFKKNDERIKELRTDFYKHLGEIRDELRKEIDAVLTPEQKQKMEAMIQKSLDERRKETEKRGKRIEPRRKENPSKENEHEKEPNHRSGDSGGSRGSHPGLYLY